MQENWAKLHFEFKPIGLDSLDHVGHECLKFVNAVVISLATAEVTKVCLEKMNTEWRQSWGQFFRCESRSTFSFAQ